MLHTWLEDAVATSLQLANGWLADRIQARQLGVKLEPPKPSLGLYEDNGSVLDIFEEIHPEHYSTLQIIKEHPLTVTDGTTFVEAELTPQCRHRLPHPRLNSTFDVREYTIRFTSYGPPHLQLRFILNEIDRHNETAPSNPAAFAPLCACEGIEALALRLKNTRSVDDRRCFRTTEGDDEDDIMAPSEHPESDDSIGSPQSPNSQSVFGTQLMPAWNLKEKSAPLGHSITRNEQNAPTERGDGPSRPAKQAQLLRLLGSNKESTSVPRAMQPPPLRTPPHSEVPGGPSEPNLAEQSQPNVSPATDNVTLSVEEKDHSTCNWMEGFHFTRNTFLVPAPQRALLTREDSWQKPPPGHHFPVANVPIYIKMAIEKHVGDRNAVNIDPPESSEGNTDTPPTRESSGNATDDALPRYTSPDNDHQETPSSEVPVSSWSQSASPEPPRPPHMDRVLPPDSSAGEQLAEKNASPRHSSQPQASPHVETTTAEQNPDRPSSPPVDLMDVDQEPEKEDGIDYDEDEMELCEPRVISQDNVEVTGPQDVVHGQKAISLIADPTILVEETPYKVKREQSALPLDNQMSCTELEDSSFQQQIPAHKREEPATIPGLRPESSGRDHALVPSTVAVEGMEITGSFVDMSSVHIPSSPSQLDVKMDLQTAGQGSPSSLEEHPLVIRPVIESTRPSSPSTKRKFIASPSKPRRQSKRREIKIPDLAVSSPVSVDRDSFLRHERKESKQRFLQQRSSLAPRSADTMDNGEIRHTIEMPGVVEDAPNAQVGSNDDIKIVDTRPVTLASLPAQESRHADPQHNRNIAPPRVSPKEHSSSVTSLNPRQTHDSLYLRFKVAYPEYTGDTNHFTRICEQILRLDEQDKMVPKWQWDDYIVRSRTDYKTYTNQCVDECVEPEPYYRFYKDEIQMPLYKKGIITGRKALEAALKDATNGLDKDSSARTKKPHIAPTGTPFTTRQVSHLEDPFITPKMASGPQTPATTISQSRSVAGLKELRPVMKSHTLTPRHEVHDPPPPSTGNAFTDFAYAHQRLTSWTGTTEVDMKNPRWPRTLAVRRSAQLPRDVVDVAEWGDVL